MSERDRTRAQRGSALLVVVVVMLVLSITGVALVTMTEKGRDTAVSVGRTKDALYAAEVGLRHGERVLMGAGTTAVDGLLAHTAQSATAAVTPATPLFPQQSRDYDLQHLGTYLTANNVELANLPVTVAQSSTNIPHPEGFYSLYLRNNPDDTSVADGLASTNATEDNDLVVRLVSVGWVQQAGTVLAVKILEEEYAWIGTDQLSSAQKHVDAGGTSSAHFGR